MSLQTSLQMNLPILFALDPDATVTTRRIKESITTFIDNLRYNITIMTRIFFILKRIHSLKMQTLSHFQLFLILHNLYIINTYTHLIFLFQCLKFVSYFSH